MVHGLFSSQNFLLEFFWLSVVCGGRAVISHFHFFLLADLYSST